MGAEYVRVVLRELAHAHDPVKRAMRLVPVAAAELGKPQRQLLVAGDALLEDLDVRRAVHRLQRHQVGVAGDHRLAFVRPRHFVRHHEHVLAELAPVARQHPQLGIDQLRGLDFIVAGGIEPPPHVGLELAPDDPAVGMPEDAAMRFALEVEQVHLLPDLAVVALAGLFEPHKIGVELLLVEPGCPVDAAEHRVLGVAAPIGAGNPRQLERLRVELAGRGEMRAAAEVDPRLIPLAGAVHGDGLARRQLHHPLGLERLA